MARAAEPAPDRERSRHELLVTILLAVAAVATAWSSYQAARWHGEQATAQAHTNAVRFEAARAESLSEAQREVDVATFIAWADADQSGALNLAEFYVDRFRPEFRVAFDAWQAADASADPSAPRTPFEMPDYEVATEQQAEELDREAEASAAEVRADIQRAGNYVLTVVMYTVALFFAGMSSQVRDGRRIRAVLVGAGYAFLLATLAWVATFPVSLAV
jgi:hypothetical protein